MEIIIENTLGIASLNFMERNYLNNTIWFNYRDCDLHITKENITINIPLSEKTDEIICLLKNDYENYGSWEFLRNYY